MRIVIAGAGIGGLTAALALYQAGFNAEVFEQASEMRELGVGINMLPHAVKELAALGLLPALERAGVRTRRLLYMTRRGQTVWEEPRGLDAGYDVPQISIHRGKLQGVLHRAAVERLGADRIHPGHRLVGFEERGAGVVAHFERRADGGSVEVTGDVLISDGSQPPPRREDWSRPGRLDEALPFVRNAFDLPFVDPIALITATDTFYEYPCCDRDPVPRRSFGRVTLLGDAAHPMYPTGSNGASQAILDARSLAEHLTSGASITEALTSYDAERRPATAAIVLSNRRGGPERVIDVIEARAPDGFDDLDAVASYAEREAIVRGYATLAGYAQDQVSRKR